MGPCSRRRTPLQTQEEDLRRLFEPFGAIMDCSIVMDPMTRKSRCVGAAQ